MPLVNASFESPTIADGTLQALTPTGWTGGAFLLNPDAGGGLSNNLALWPQAPDGQQYEDIGNEPKFSISQAFTVSDAGIYHVQWMDNTALTVIQGFQTVPYSVSLFDSSSTQVFGSNFNSYHSGGAWQTNTITQALGAGIYKLTFTSLNTANHTDTVIDRVSVNTAPSTVPEPGSAVLMVLGLLLFFVLSRTILRPRHDA